MQHIPPQQAKKRYFSLSAPLQDALFSDRTSDSIRKAAILGGVEEKASLLAKLTGYVLMGYLNPLNFKDELKNELGLSEESAKQVASQLDTEVFSLVSSDIRKLYPPTIKTPTASSYGFSPDTDSKKIKKHLSQEPSEFEKRFFKKRTELKKPNVKETVKQPEKKQINEESKPFFEKHEIGEHNLKVFEKIHKEKKRTVDQIVEEQIAKNKLKHPFKNIQTEKKQSTDANSLIAKKIIKSMNTTQDKAKINSKLEKDSETIKNKIKPVMPLPTFIQSQFQPKRTSDSNPKLDGNVIDLRDL